MYRVFLEDRIMSGVVEHSGCCVGQPGLHKEFQVSLGCIRKDPVLKKNKDEIKQR